MFYRNNIYLLIVGLLLWMVSGCATGGQRTAKVQSPTRTAVAQATDENSSSGASGSMLVHESDIQPFANRVAWPEYSDNLKEAVYQILSGVNDDGVWVEGKGYFKGKIDKVHEDLVNPQIMGPTYMTKDISIHDLKESPVLTTYVMHVKLKYIMTVEFDIGVTIDALYDDNDKIIGWRYRSEKVDGTRFITRIDEQIIIKQINDEWFKVESMSINQATMNKEEETRQHFETVFRHWAGETGNTN